MHVFCNLFLHIFPAVCSASHVCAKSKRNVPSSKFACTIFCGCGLFFNFYRKAEDHTRSQKCAVLLLVVASTCKPTSKSGGVVSKKKYEATSKCSETPHCSETSAPTLTVSSGFQPLAGLFSAVFAVGGDISLWACPPPHFSSMVARYAPPNYLTTSIVSFLVAQP